MTKKLTVIVPTYKPKDYIWKCLDSLKNQTLDSEAYEIILVLNGDKDPYYNKISEYIKKEEIKNVNFIHTNTRGLSNARNIGLQNAAGQNIVFIDDDDYVANNYLKSLLGKAEGDTVVLSDNFFFEDKTNRKLSNPRSSAYKPDHETNNILEFRKFYRMAWGKLMPRDMIGNIRFDTKIFTHGEDTVFMMETLRMAKKIKTIENGCYYYRRIRKGSIIGYSRSLKERCKNSSYVILKHVNILFKPADLRHKIIVFASILGLTRSFLRSLILRKT